MRWVSESPHKTQKRANIFTKRFFSVHKTNYCIGKRPLLGSISYLAILVDHGLQKVDEQRPWTGGGIGQWVYVPI
jgi:hypothetical protein